MNKIRKLCKITFFSYLTDPLYLFSSILTILYCTFKFFFIFKFFNTETSSTDLRPLFASIPEISILTFPLLILKNHRFITDSSLPFSSINKHLSTLIATFTAAFIPFLLLLTVPLAVNFFGDVEAGQIISGYIGTALYLFCALSVIQFIFALISTNLPLAFIISSIILASLNFMYMIPLYLECNAPLTFLFQKFSFSWNLNSFTKGIIDTKNAAFFLITSTVFILLDIFADFRREGRKVNSLTTLLLTGIFVFLTAGFSNLYFRLDLSKTKQFSISDTSRKISALLEKDLKITYFRSKELRTLYPQTDDIIEFLMDFASLNKNISLNIKKAEPEKLKALGIQGQQIESTTSSKKEYITIYSAILLQYGDKSSFVPFCLSTQTLEYDICQRLQVLLTGKERNVCLISGNNRKIQESYSYVEPWLNSRGFSAIIPESDEIISTIKNLSSDCILAIFGSCAFSSKQYEAIIEALSEGRKAFIATSPFTVNIEEQWTVSKSEEDYLIDYLNSSGFAFNYELAEDLSCQTLTMASNDSNTEYVTINYPLWISVLNQQNAQQGLTLFWPSPIKIYQNVEPLIVSTAYAWTQKSNSASGELFLTNPFTIPKSSKEAGASPERLILGAKNENIILIPDQFFLSSLMVSFISNQNRPDFRNFDYFVTSLLNLSANDELSSLMNKSALTTRSYKISDINEFNHKKSLSIVLCMIVPAVIMIVFMLSYCIIKGTKKYNFEG